MAHLSPEFEAKLRRAAERSGLVLSPNLVEFALLMAAWQDAKTIEECALICDKRADAITRHINASQNNMREVTLLFAKGVVATSRRNASSIRALRKPKHDRLRASSLDSI